MPGAVLGGNLRHATQGKNAGTYSTEDGTLQLSGLYSTQQGYDIRYTGGVTRLSIDKATLTLKAVTDTKTYDGSTVSSQKVTVSGLAKGDKVAGLKQSFDSKKVGKHKLTIDSGYTATDDNGGKNYTVKTVGAAGRIQ